MEQPENTNQPTNIAAEQPGANAITAQTSATGQQNAKYQKPLTKEQAIKAAILGIFFGSFGIHDFMMRKPLLGIIHIVLSISGLGAMTVLIPIMIFDAFKCGTGTIAECPGLGIGMTDEQMEAIIIVPFYISIIMAIIEVIILFATASKYPSKKSINTQQQ